LGYLRLLVNEKHQNDILVEVRIPVITLRPLAHNVVVLFFIDDRTYCEEGIGETAP
jgi:hypothetical protein